MMYSMLQLCLYLPIAQITLFSTCAFAIPVYNLVTTDIGVIANQKGKELGYSDFNITSSIHLLHDSLPIKCWVSCFSFLSMIMQEQRKCKKNGCTFHFGFVFRPCSKKLKGFSSVFYRMHLLFAASIGIITLSLP